MIDLSSIFDRPILMADNGRVTETADYHSEKVFVNISEIPCHPEIQTNIAKILEFIDTNFSIKKVFQVYSVGEYKIKGQFGLLAKKPDNLEQLLAAGQVTGAEYYADLQGKEHFLFGVDETDLYIEALRLHQQVSQSSPVMDQLVRGLQDELETLKARYFTQENQSFNRDILDQKNHTTDWFYQRLAQYTDVLTVSRSDYRNLYYYIENMKNRDAVNSPRTSNEIQEIINRLKSEIAYRDYSRLLSATDNYNKGGLLYIYLSRIIELAPEIGANLPYAQRFLSYRNINQNINPVDLIAEEQACIHEIFRRNVQTFAEKEVVFLVEFVNALNRFFHFSSRDNYEYFHAHYHRAFKKLWAKYTGEDILSRIEKHVAIADSYYKSSLKRGERFIQNSHVLERNLPGMPRFPSLQESYLDQAMNTLKEAKEIYVFVTGGFHAKLLAQEFRKVNCSYMVITPNVTRDAGLVDCYQTLRNKVQAQQGTRIKLFL